MPDKFLNYGRHILQRWAQEIPVGAALDIGGGLGADLDTIKNLHEAADRYAIESNIHYANHLKSRQIQTYNINLENTSLPFDNDRIDLVIANQILEHTKEVFWALHEITRVLRVGGHLYLGLPNLASLHNRVLLLFGKQPTCIRNSTAHVRGFTKSDVLDLLTECWPDGYRLSAFAGSNFYPLPARLAQIAARIAPTAAVSIFFLLRKEKEYKDEFIKFPEKLETNFFLGRNLHHVVVAD